jgi:hypothetical protein
VRERLRTLVAAFVVGTAVAVEVKPEPWTPPPGVIRVARQESVAARFRRFGFRIRLRPIR